MSELLMPEVVIPFVGIVGGSAAFWFGYVAMGIPLLSAGLTWALLDLIKVDWR